MNATKLYALMEKEFSSRIGSKTGWGKNEIMREFNISWTISVNKMIDEQEIERKSTIVYQVPPTHETGQ